MTKLLERLELREDRRHLDERHDTRSGVAQI